MNELTLQIEGMSCDHCVRHVTKALQGTPGITVKQVRVGSATVDYDGRPESLDAIVQAIDRAGYTARPESETHVSSVEHHH